MTKIQALRSIVKCFRTRLITEIVLLKDEEHGYTYATTLPCVQYQVRFHPQNVVRIYKRVGRDGLDVRSYVLSVQERKNSDPVPGPLLFVPKPRAKNQKRVAYPLRKILKSQ